MAVDSEGIRQVAKDYTEAWCPRSGEQVAPFFSENATSIINKGEPVIGRVAIAEAMGAFFVEVPDLVLFMDDSRRGGNLAICFWTLEGAHIETGNSIRIPRLAKYGALRRFADRGG
ncbi:MAG: nuclear transport factor 2 family protein [Acidiferrobacterales bacterium]|nr:nuclear transport factor 2 family protein [Acidiferrobacterales bacterium]